MLIRVEIFDNNYKKIHIGDTLKVKAIERDIIDGVEVAELVEVEGELEEMDTEYLGFHYTNENGNVCCLEVKFEDIKSLEFVR